MSRLQVANVGASGHAPAASADRSPVAPADIPPGGLLEVIPIPDTGQVMVITAHILPAEDAATPAPAAEASGGTERRPAAAEPDGLIVERDARRVWADGREVPLTFQEFELLDYLTARPGKVFSRIHLMNVLWAGATVGVPRTVDVHIHRLRRKLGRHGRRLVTVRRVGYGYRPPEDLPSPDGTVRP